MNRQPPDQTVVILPTWNEVDNIDQAITRLYHYLPDIAILVVDDQSADGTGQRVQELQNIHPRLYLLSRQRQNGLGGAYRAGFRWALSNGFDRIVEMDADGSHHPADLLRMLIESRPHTVTIGSRYVPGGQTVGWPLIRRGLSWLANTVVRYSVGLMLHDWTSGFVCWPAEVLRTIPFNELPYEGYIFQVALKLDAITHGFPVVELPITFTERLAGQSKLHLGMISESLLALRSLRRVRAMVVKDEAL